MTLDSPRNWRHAEQLERGDVPMIPETRAACRIASLIGTYIDRRYITDLALQDFAAKVIANRATVRSILDEYEGDPKRIADRGLVLRQQGTASLSDLDFFLEQQAYHERGAREAAEVVAKIRARGVAEHDPDEVAADREDDRAREQRQSDAAREQAPKVAS